MRFGTFGSADGLFGTATVSSSVFDGFSANGLIVENESGALSITVTGVAMSNNQAGVAAGVGADGIRLNAGGTSTMVASIAGASTFNTLRGSGVFGSPRGTGTLDITVSGNSFDDTDTGAGAITVIPQQASTARARIVGNTILDASGFGVILETETNANLDGWVDANTVGDGTFGSGSGNHGIAMFHVSDGTARFLIENNVLTSHAGSGIFSYNEDPLAAVGVDANVIIRNNSVAAPETIVRAGVDLQSVVDATLCADVTGNTSAGSVGASGIEVLQSGTSIFQVVGLGALAVDVYLAGANTSTAASNGGAYVAAPAACSAPTPPSVP
jgi:hypothetical protein